MVREGTEVILIRDSEVVVMPKVVVGVQNVSAP